MLYIEAYTTAHDVDGAGRLQLLDRLEERGLSPVIRSARLSCYDQALMRPDHVKEMERVIALWTQAEESSVYVRGDLFCFEDHTLFLLFGHPDDEWAGMQAGIIYAAETPHPNRKLDAFCSDINEALSLMGKTSVDWTREERDISEQLAVSKEFERDESDLERPPEFRRASEVLEDLEARRLLRRIQEAHADGRTSELVRSEESTPSGKVILTHLLDSGLLHREVVVICRREERPLFRLPSPDALSAITASNAKCSECGIPISDEKVEELIVPSETAIQLLDEASWLVSRITSVVRQLGIPDNEVRKVSGRSEGEPDLLVNVCGQPFLIAAREGDLGSIQAGRILDLLVSTEIYNMAVIVTGKVRDDGRARLRDFGRKQSRTGHDTAMIIVEGLDAAAGELQHAFDRIAQRALSERLASLDASLGISVGFMIATRFRLARKYAALRDLAESAVDALAGSLSQV